MHPIERTDLIKFLQAGELEFIEAINAVDTAAARIRPGPQHWSILDVAEHVVLVERALLAGLASAQPRPEPLLNPRRERAIREFGAVRTRRVEAPAFAHPAARFSTLEEASAEFLEARAAALHWLTAFDGDLHSLSNHHPILGEINGYEAVLLLAVHPARHAAQIREIRAALDAASS